MSARRRSPSCRSLSLRAGLFGLGLVLATAGSVSAGGRVIDCALGSKESPEKMIAACSSIVDNSAAKKIEKRSPVVGARIINGLVPCNVIAEEILTDHPRRYRAMLIESGNPVHSLADAQKMRDALSSLELVVVIDIAMTEVYKDVKFFEKPSDKYREKAFKIAQERMALAGYRMGDLFNEVFGVSAAAPAVAPKP